MPLSKILSPLPASYRIERYTLAIACAGISIFLRALLEPVLGHTSFYFTVYVGVIFSALVCGVFPAVLTAFLGSAGIVYWFVDPRGSIVIFDKADLQGLIACVLGCAALIALGEANRRKQLRLNEAQETLEGRVRDRTRELLVAMEKLESEVRVRNEVEVQLRNLSLRLMTIQDEERRRIARDLHDSAGQTLAAIKMSLAMLEPVPRSASGSSAFDKLIEDLNALADEALKEIRTTSYLLHPPLLDEAGFASAARWFAQGFTKRSGIEVRCELPEACERFPETVELALFRLLQESLTNIHRHSGASAATITFAHTDDGLELQIADNGHGLSREQLGQFQQSDGGTGVGIAGMRERVRSLRGRLLVESGGGGTIITVKLPNTSLKAPRDRAEVSVA